MSLRIRLVLLILIAALPVLAVEVVDSLRERRAAEAQLAEEALRLADLKAERLAGLVELARGAATAFAQLPVVLERDEIACSKRLVQLREQLPEFGGMAVFDSQGQAFCRTAGDGSLFIGDRPYFQRAVRERHFVSSGYLVDRARNEPAMVFVAPAIDPSGELRALVLLAYDLAKLPQLVGGADLPEGATVKLIDIDGNLLVRMPPWEGPGEESASILERLRFGPRGTAIGAGTDGVEREYGYVPMPEPARLEVVVGIPLEPALAGIDAQMWRRIAVTGAIFALAALAAMFIGETGISRPLVAVQAAAGRLARGDLAARAHVGRGAADEVDALADSLNEMADAIAARETKLAASEEFGRRMLASSRDCVEVLDLDGRMLSINAIGREALEIDDETEVLGRYYADLWGGEPPGELGEALTQARRGEAARFLGMARSPSGRTTWWDVSLSAIADSRGRPERLLAVSRDMTELKQAEQHRELLMAELDHRVKNTLAAVQSIARRTLGPGRQADAFVERVAAMATAHSLLSSSHWEGGALTALLAGVLAAHSDRISLHGAEVELDAQTTQSLALAAHELATNAAKHGALSSGGGHVELRWTLVGNGRRELRLEWREHGGPAAERPDEAGFGLSLLRRTVQYELGGRIELEFRPEGLRCRIALPLRLLSRAEAAEGVGAAPPAQSGSPAAPPSESCPMGARVLVLEDSALVAMEIETILTDAGYEVVGPAATVAEALRLLEGRPIDAAVLDVNLRGETSFPVATALRDTGTPFVFVTGYSNRAVFPPELLDAPRLAKPFQERNLLATLAAAAAPAAGTA